MASPLSSSTLACALVADRGGEMDHGVDPAQRLADQARVRELGEVAENEPHLDPEPAEAARIADHHPDLVAALEQPRQQRPADRSGRAGRPKIIPALSESLGSARPANGWRTTANRLADDEKGKTLAYVIAEPCIGQKDNSCVEVCPVDCIHPTPDEPDYEGVEQLYIDPDECIDCDACVEACPVDACFAEDQLPAEWAKYTEINAEYFKS